MDDGKIDVGKPPTPIDPKEHHAAMLGIRKLDVLGMAMPANVKPTAGLMSYLHDPARRTFTWNRRTTLQFGDSEGKDEISRKTSEPTHS